MIELVLGGARSGKSGYAEARAAESGLSVGYIATAQPLDAEMAERILHHQSRRPASWELIESPIFLADSLHSHASVGKCLIVDCLTLWLSNLLLLEEAEGEGVFVAQRDALLDALSRHSGNIILVSNEVGMGVVPMGSLTRKFVDEAGRLNQKLAAIADQVTLVVAGLPQVLKPRA